MATPSSTLRGLMLDATRFHEGVRMNKSAPQISTVIAGLGRAGWDIHWRQLLQGHPAFRVVGAIEPVAERRAEAEIGYRTYPSFDAFLADPVGEQMVLATPSGVRETIAVLETCRRQNVAIWEGS